MTSLRVSDEIKVIGLLRRECSSQRCVSRVRNGAGWKSRMPISVVRRFERHGLRVKRAGVLAGELQRINDCGVTLQRHVIAQSIREYACNKRALLRLWRFTLNQRSQRNDFIHG